MKMQPFITTTSFVHPERHILWHRWGEPGIEHLYLRGNDENVIADNMIVGMIDGHLLRLYYEVTCDSAYRFQTVHLQMLQPFQQTLTLSLAHDGVWRDGDKNVLSNLAGGSDIDLSASPFTNTLPIRRLNLQLDQAVEIQVAFIELPAFAIRPERQRYTFIRTSNDYDTYRFEHLSNGYSVDIQVDPDGLVLDYPGLFRRVYTQ
jgi:uncharacterized protein